MISFRFLEQSSLHQLVFMIELNRIYVFIDMLSQPDQSLYFSWLFDMCSHVILYTLQMSNPGHAEEGKGIRFPR